MLNDFSYQKTLHNKVIRVLKLDLHNSKIGKENAGLIFCFDSNNIKVKQSCQFFAKKG